VKPIHLLWVDVVRENGGLPLRSTAKELNGMKVKDLHALCGALMECGHQHDDVVLHDGATTRLVEGLNLQEVTRATKWENTKESKYDWDLKPVEPYWQQDIICLNLGRRTRAVPDES
jgi:hypothetical protein